MTRLHLIPALLLVLACTPDAPPPPAPPTSTCGAQDLQGLVGQPATVLQTMKFGTVTRITRPGQAVTMDYSDRRLNIHIDKAERIERVSCG
jgi:hypothetical protein